MEGLKVSDSDLVVYLHPSKSNKVRQSIIRELSSLLFTFSETFESIILAYDVDFQDKCARILPGVHPYFGVRLKAKLLLFSPKPDMLTEGKVVKVTRESIHVIVLGFSSAIISDKDIRGEFIFQTKHNQGRYASKQHKRHVIKVGTMIRFLVKSFEVEILHFVGSLVSAHTGKIRWLEKNLQDASLISRSSLKRKEGERELVPLEDGSVGEGLDSFGSKLKLKNSKKQRTGE